MRTKEEMRLYQKERRLKQKTAKIRSLLNVIPQKLSFEELKNLRGTTVPIDDGFKIYFLFSGDEIVYIGQTRSLLNRISNHKNGLGLTMKKDFNSIAVIDSDRDNINYEEYCYISHYAPKYNKNHKDNNNNELTIITTCNNYNNL